jgi:tellurite resistance protein
VPSPRTRKSSGKRPAKRPAARRGRQRPLSVDQAIIAVLVESMLANGHASAEEHERAHHAIWSMRRFERRSGETVGRLVEGVRERITLDGGAVVVQQASTIIPPSLRPSVLAVAADLVLVDGTLQRQERQFLGELARQLKIAPALALQILKVVAIKNAV